MASPTVKNYPVKFVWDHGGSEVFLSLKNAQGENRTLAVPYHHYGHHEVTIMLPAGRFEYRYTVDGEWSFDLDLPALKNEKDHYSNMIKVKAPSLNEVQMNKTPRGENLQKARSKVRQKMHKPKKLEKKVEVHQSGCRTPFEDTSCSEDLIQDHLPSPQAAMDEEAILSLSELTDTADIPDLEEAFDQVEELDRDPVVNKPSVFLTELDPTSIGTDPDLMSQCTDVEDMLDEPDQPVEEVNANIFELANLFSAQFCTNLILSAVKDAAAKPRRNNIPEIQIMIEEFQDDDHHQDPLNRSTSFLQAAEELAEFISCDLVGNITKEERIPVEEPLFQEESVPKLYDDMEKVQVPAKKAQGKRGSVQADQLANHLARIKKTQKGGEEKPFEACNNENMNGPQQKTASTMMPVKVTDLDQVVHIGEGSDGSEEQFSSHVRKPRIIYKHNIIYMDQVRTFPPESPKKTESEHDQVIKEFSSNSIAKMPSRGVDEVSQDPSIPIANHVQNECESVMDASKIIAAEDRSEVAEHKALKKGRESPMAAPNPPNADVNAENPDTPLKDNLDQAESYINKVENIGESLDPNKIAEGVESKKTYSFCTYEKPIDELKVNDINEIASIATNSPQDLVPKRDLEHVLTENNELAKLKMKSNAEAREIDHEDQGSEEGQDDANKVIEEPTNVQMNGFRKPEESEKGDASDHADPETKGVPNFNFNDIANKNLSPKRNNPNPMSNQRGDQVKQSLETGEGQDCLPSNSDPKVEHLDPLKMTTYPQKDTSQETVEANLEIVPSDLEANYHQEASESGSNSQDSQTDLNKVVLQATVEVNQASPPLDLKAKHQEEPLVSGSNSQDSQTELDKNTLQAIIEANPESATTSLKAKHHQHQASDGGSIGQDSQTDLNKVVVQATVEVNQASTPSDIKAKHVGEPLVSGCNSQDSQTELDKNTSQAIIEANLESATPSLKAKHHQYQASDSGYNGQDLPLDLNKGNLQDTVEANPEIAKSDLDGDHDKPQNIVPNVQESHPNFEDYLHPMVHSDPQSTKSAPEAKNHEEAPDGSSNNHDLAKDVTKNTSVATLEAHPETDKYDTADKSYEEPPAIGPVVQYSPSDNKDNLQQPKKSNPQTVESVLEAKIHKEAPDSTSNIQNPATDLETRESKNTAHRSDSSTTFQKAHEDRIPVEEPLCVEVHIDPLYGSDLKQGPKKAQSTIAFPNLNMPVEEPICDIMEVALLYETGNNSTESLRELLEPYDESEFTELGLQTNTSQGTIQNGDIGGKPNYDADEEVDGEMDLDSDDDSDFENWVPSEVEVKTRKGKDIFSEVRNELSAIQKSKSNSDMFVHYELSKSASKSKFLDEVRQKKGDLKDEERPKESGKTTLRRKKRERRDKPRPKRSRSAGDRSSKLFTASSSSSILDLGVKPEDEYRPKRRTNPYEDMPKKLDEVFGQIRSEQVEPTPKPEERVAVYFETGDYSVAGMQEAVKLKPTDLKTKANGQKIRRGVVKPKEVVQEEETKTPAQVQNQSEPPPLKALGDDSQQEPIILVEQANTETKQVSTPAMVIEPTDPKPMNGTQEPPIADLIQLEEPHVEPVKEVSEPHRILKSEVENALQTNGVEEAVPMLAPDEDESIMAKPFINDDFPIPDDLEPPKIGINGFERMGRLVLRAAFESGLEIQAINDAFIPANFMVYGLKYDVAHCNKKYHQEDMTVRQSPTGQLIVNGKSIHVFECRDSAKIPWEEAGVNYVIETSEALQSVMEAQRHLRSPFRGMKKPKPQSLTDQPRPHSVVYGGCHRVVIASPNSDAPLYAVGVNDHKLDANERIRSHVSPAASALLPILRVVEDSFGLRSCGYTILKSIKVGDSKSIKCPSLGPSSHSKAVKWDFTENLVPSVLCPVTEEICRLIPSLSGKVHGICVYVPTPDVSMIDMTLQVTTSSNHIYRDICLKLKEAAEGPMRPIIRYCMKQSDENPASSIFASDTHSAIIDAKSGGQITGDTIKLVVWYDNDYGYANRIIDLITQSHILQAKDQHEPFTME